jgi:hypothetical protein
MTLLITFQGFGQIARLNGNARSNLTGSIDNLRRKPARSRNRFTASSHDAHKVLRSANGHVLTGGFSDFRNTTNNGSGGRPSNYIRKRPHNRTP